MAERDSESTHGDIRSSSKSTHTTNTTLSQLRVRIPTPSELPGSSTLPGPPAVDLAHPLVLHFAVPHPDELASSAAAREGSGSGDFGDTKSVGTSKSRGRAMDFRKRARLALANADVLTRDDEVLFRFHSEDMGQMEMLDREGRLIAFLEDGVVSFLEERTRVKNFVRKKAPGNTGPVIVHDSHPYEWIQEQFYGLIRTSPGAERAAIIYDQNDPPAIELVEEATRIHGLTERIVFAFVLIQSGIGNGRPKSRIRGRSSTGGIMKRWLGAIPFARTI